MRTSESKDELVAALAYIETHPEEWNQHTWVCGTSACLGGRAAMLSPEIERVLPAYGPTNTPWLMTTDGQRVDLVAWLYYRFPGCQALWSGSNDLDALRRGVKAYCNGDSVEHAVRYG